MFRNFFVIALRNILKKKLFSFINIAGLAAGVAACLVILKYVDFESGYDDFQKNGPDLYRVIRAEYEGKGLTAKPVISTYALGPTLAAEVPEVMRYVRTHEMYGGAVLTFAPAGGERVTLHEDKIQMVDSTFLDAFTYEAVAGDLATALDHSNSIVITSAMAQKYFGKTTDPIGKVMSMLGGWSDGDYVITAVIKSVPENSHFVFDFLIPIHNLLKDNSQYKNDSGWDWNNFITYVQLNPHADRKATELKFKAIAAKYIDARRSNKEAHSELVLQPVTSIHVTPGLAYEMSATISPNTLYFFLLIAVFILAIAWVNYINLSTARAMERAHEVGIKKAIGAFRGQLIRQFLLESVLINFFAIILAAGLAVLLLPVLDKMIGKNLSFDFTDYRLWTVLAGLFVVGALVSGIYPAFVLSSFRITDAMKGTSERGRFSLRKALVVFQFASSVVLIAGTFGVYRQLIFMRSHDKGLTTDQMLIVTGPSIVDWKLVLPMMMHLKDEFRNLPGVSSVATSGAVPGGGHQWGTMLRKEGAPATDSRSGSVVWIDPDFLDTYNLQLISGKNFNPGIKSDMESVLVNEAAVKAFGLGDPDKAITKRLLLGNDTVAILGVLKNYNWNSLKSEHVPFLFKADTASSRAVSIHLNGRDIQGTIAAIEKKYKEIFPGNPFDYFFLDEFFDRQYRADQQFGKIFGLFAGLAIGISCLGLWGLAAFTTSQRLKEIGIRKVLGASAGNIVVQLSWQFLKLVLIACAVGLPIAWYGLRSWLQTFAFRTGLQWDLFAVPVLALCAVALATVSLQIVRGARTNPAVVLRSE